MTGPPRKLICIIPSSAPPEYWKVCMPSRWMMPKWWKWTTLCWHTSFVRPKYRRRPSTKLSQNPWTKPVDQRPFRTKQMSQRWETLWRVGWRRWLRKRPWLHCITVFCAPGTNHYTMSFQETAIWIYILWLLLLVFSSGDYDLPQVPIIIQCRFKKQLLYIYIMINYTCFQLWRQEQVLRATRKVKNNFFHEREVSIYQWQYNWYTAIYIYYDYYCMFSSVATLTFPRVGWGKSF